MTIRQVGPMTEITPGQWICRDPLMRDHICSDPRKVIRRSGKRVYFENRHGVDSGDYCAVSSVVALCDTKDEADRVFAISDSQAASLRQVRDTHANKLKFIFETSQ